MESKRKIKFTARFLSLTRFVLLQIWRRWRSMTFIPNRQRSSTILSLIFAKNISLWFPSVCSARCAKAKSNIYHVTISFFHAIIFATSLDNVWSCRPKNRSVLWVLRSRSSWRCSRRTWARRSASICLSFVSIRNRRRSSRSRSIFTKIRKYLLCDIFFRRWRCSNRFENEVHCMSVPGVYLWKMSSTRQQKPNGLLSIHWFNTCLLLHFISISFDTHIHIHIFFVQVCQIYSFEPRESERERTWKERPTNPVCRCFLYLCQSYAIHLFSNVTCQVSA